MDSDEKTPSQEAPPEAPRPKIVRNREVDKAATALAEEHILPLPPGKSLTWDQAQQYLALLTPGMWSHVSVYVYRLKPKIRRQLRDPNSPNYIDCLGEPFTLDYFISRHGGGKYSLQATDTEGRNNNARELFKCTLDINDVQHPPILNYEELELDARENKSYIAWLQNKGILDGLGKVIHPNPQPPPPASTTTNLSAKDVLDIMGYAHKMTADQQNQFRQQFAPGEDSLSKSVGTILLEKMKQDDPGKVFAQMMGFLEKINKPDTSFTQIMQMQLEWTKLLLQSQNNNNAPKNQFGEFREFFMFARDILQSGGGSGRRNNWDTGIEIARDVVIPGLQTISTAVTNIMALRNGHPPISPVPGARPASPQPPMPAAFDPYANPAAMRQYSTNMSGQQPAQETPPVQPPPPPPSPPPGPENQLFGLFQQYGSLVVNALNNGTPGYDFADYVTGLLGTATHAMIASQGEEALAQTMLMIPEIGIFGEQRIRAFVTEFIHYQEYLEGQETGEEEPDTRPEPEIEMPKIYRPPQRSTIRPHA